MWEDWLTPKPPRRWRGGKNQCIAHLGSLRKQETEGTAQKGRLKKERRVNRRRDRGRAAFAGSAECLAGQGRPVAIAQALRIRIWRSIGTIAGCRRQDESAHRAALTTNTISKAMVGRPAFWTAGDLRVSHHDCCGVGRRHGLIAWPARITLPSVIPVTIWISASTRIFSGFLTQRRC